MRTGHDLYEFLDALAPFAGAARWDSIGFQVGDADRPVACVGLVHEVTQAAIEAAVSATVDLLVAYHPLLFNPTTRFLAGPSPEGRALALAEEGITLLVTHTAFDVAAGGTAEQLASRVGVGDIEPLTDPSVGADEDPPAIGRIGAVKLTTLAELAATVEERLASEAVRWAGRPDREIRRVAVVPGSGSSFIDAAAAAGADALVTGDVSHHRAVAALDQGIGIIDAGHIATERPGLESLRAALEAELGDGFVDLTHLDADPWARSAPVPGG